MSTFFQHDQAIVETAHVGGGTRVWAFAHILPGARIGSDCNICDHTFVENDVVIGDRVTVKCGVQLWDGVRIEDDVFIGPNATFTNDPFPRSRQHQAADRIPTILIKRNASIGANATVLPGVTVGERAMVGAGSVVTHDVPADAVAVGNPARIVGYVGAAKPDPSAGSRTGGTAILFDVRGVVLHELPRVEDMRGALTVAERSAQLPFGVERCFIVFDVPSKEVRGEHAHRTLHQFLICVHGACSVIADDGVTRREFRLDSPGVGLYIPPLTWSVQYKYTPDAVLAVMASARYDPEDYVRDYDEFLRLRRSMDASA
jgi:acetyltransferase-like isoleucine patch superfamily enzyme